MIPPNVRSPPCDHNTSFGDHMTASHRSATTDVDVNLEPGMVDHSLQDTTQSTPSIDKLPQAKALQVHTPSEHRVRM